MRLRLIILTTLLLFSLNSFGQSKNGDVCLTFYTHLKEVAYLEHTLGISKERTDDNGYPFYEMNESSMKIAVLSTVFKIDPPTDLYLKTHFSEYYWLHKSFLKKDGEYAEYESKCEKLYYSMRKEIHNPFSVLSNTN